MDSKRYQRVAEIFDQVSEAPPEQCYAILDQACCKDAELRAEVESLLSHDKNPEYSLNSPVINVSMVAAAHDQLVDQTIGSFRIKRLIASGGMGAVYEAIQDNPQRSVALKLMRNGIASRSALRRFEFEAQLLARLHHPGIAQIYEAGTHDVGTGAVPFFAMEFIADAHSITAYANQKKLTTPERLELFVKVCEAVHHGHQRGIIHRDLKPSNILVDPSGQPKIIDFGVARSTDSDVAVTTLQTSVGELIGTLQYMSPEQCTADPRDVDTRSDVYSLGVVLFELLCGQLPYDISQVRIYEATRVIREHPPSKPSTINRKLRGDLDTIVLKALEKERDRRYQSALDLSQDIQRYLKSQPISARPPSTVYQLRTFAKRNKVLVSAAAVVFLALIGGIVATSLQARIAAQQRLIAVAVNEFLNQDLLSAADPRMVSKDVTVREALDIAAERIESRFPDQPLVQAELHHTLGRTYSGLGEFAKSVEHYSLAAQTFHNAAGFDDPRTLSARRGQGQSLSMLNKYEEAEPILRDALQRQRRVLGNDHIHTLATITALANAIKHLDKYEEAEQLARGVLSMPYSVLERDHRARISAMDCLGAILLKSRRPDEAVLVFKDALPASEQVYGEDHPFTAGLIVQYVAALEAAKRPLEELAPLARRAYETRRRLLGELHMSTLISANFAAGVYIDLGELEEAEPILNDMFAVWSRERGEQNIGTQTLIDWYVDLFERWHAAEPHAGHDKTADYWRSKLSGHDTTEPHPVTSMTD